MSATTKTYLMVNLPTPPFLFKGPPNAKAATGIGGDELTDEERVLLAQIQASVDAIVKASKAN